MRLPNWPHALAEYLRACHDRPFAWGAHDCAQFAAGAVAVQTGVRPALPRYRSAPGAARLLRQRSLRDRVTDILSAEIPVARAQRGDVVLAAGETGPALGVCMGEASMFLEKRGLRTVATLACTAAWAVESLRETNPSGSA